jgi:hypothetical protein
MYQESCYFINPIVGCLVAGVHWLYLKRFMLWKCLSVYMKYAAMGYTATHIRTARVHCTIYCITLTHGEKPSG